jgi:hypothetical protein
MKSFKSPSFFTHRISPLASLLSIALGGSWVANANVTPPGMGVGAVPGAAVNSPTSPNFNPLLNPQLPAGSGVATNPTGTSNSSLNQVPSSSSTLNSSPSFGDPLNQSGAAGTSTATSNSTQAPLGTGCVGAGCSTFSNSSNPGFLPPGGNSSTQQAGQQGATSAAGPGDPSLGTTSGTGVNSRDDDNNNTNTNSPSGGLINRDER